MAKKGVNKATIVGKLGRDPDSKKMTNGNLVTNISVATSEVWMDQNGKPREETEWHDIVAYDGLAAIMAKYLAKGSEVYIEGRMKTNRWKDANGSPKSKKVVVATEMQMLGERRDKTTSSEKLMPSKNYESARQEGRNSSGSSVMDMSGGIPEDF